MTPRVSMLLLLAIGACLTRAQTMTKEECLRRQPVLDSAVDNMTMVISENVNGYESVQDFEDNYCSPFAGWFAEYNRYKACLKCK